MRIAVDFDSTIGRIMPPVLALLNRREKLSLTLDDVQEYPAAFERLGLKNQFFHALSEVHRSPMLEFVDEHCLPTLRWFDRHPDIDWYVLTGNPHHVLHPIWAFMRDHGFRAEIESSFGQEKYEYEWDLLIDDDPRLAQRENVIIYAQPWNQHARSIGYRVKDWDDIRLILEAKL